MNSLRLLLSVCLFALAASSYVYANDNKSTINNPNQYNRNRVVELKTLTGTQQIEMEADGSVLSSKEIYSTIGNRRVKSAMAKFSKTLADLRPSKDARFVYLTTSKTTSKDVTAENVENLCLKFIDDNQNKLGFNTSNIRMTNKHFQKDKWFVDFIQTYDGIDVLSSYISLVVFPNGRIQSFDAIYFNNINNFNNFNNIALVKPKPDFPLVVAVTQAAIAGLTRNNFNSIQVKPKPLVIMPVFEGKEFAYKLAYICEVSFSGMNGGAYTAIVDAQSGELISRQNLTMNFEGVIESRNFGVNPNAPLVIDTLKNWMRFTWRGRDTSFRRNGTFDFPEEAIGEPFTLKLHGQWAKLWRGILGMSTPVEYTYSGNITNRGIILHDSNGYDELFRTIYVHLNLAHTYLKEIDPFFSGLDKVMPLYCQILPESQRESYGGGLQFNAFAVADLYIGFYSVNHKRIFIGMAPTVLYHEYGHSIVYAKYKIRNIYRGMTNRTANEGIADITSALIQDNPNISENTLAPGVPPGWGIGRTCENNFVYHHADSGTLRHAMHYDSQILSGTLWDYRKNINDVRAAGINVHLAKNYYPDGYTLDDVFANWFEALVKAADSVNYVLDDDGIATFQEYSHHFNEINSAFIKHGIGFDLYVQNKFEHENVTDVAAGTPVEIVAKIPVVTPKPIEDVWVNYRTWSGGQPREIKLERNGDEYRGTIPAHGDDGLRISYYFTYIDPHTGGDRKRIHSRGDAASRNFEYYYLSGFRSIYKDPCEQTLGWRIDANNATNGWALTEPSLVTTQDRVALVNPGYSYDDSKCWATQASVPDDDLVSLVGTSTLTSSVLPIANSKNPVLTYYSYLYNSRNDTANGMNVQASFDGGTTWHTLQEFRRRQLPINWDWSRQFVRIQNPDNPNETYNNVRIRFVSTSTSQQYHFISMIDGIDILDADNFSKVDDFYDVSSSNIVVSPNPSNNETTLTFERALFNPEIQITNTLGIEVFSERYFGEFIDKRLDVSGFNNGVYFVKIKSQGRIYSTKINIIK